MLYPVSVEDWKEVEMDMGLAQRGRFYVVADRDVRRLKALKSGWLQLQMLESLQSPRELVARLGYVTQNYAWQPVRDVLQSREAKIAGQPKPLSGLFDGGEDIFLGGDFRMVVHTPREAGDYSAALSQLDPKWLDQEVGRARGVPAADSHGNLYVRAVRGYCRIAAKTNACLIFLVDQGGVTVYADAIQSLLPVPQDELAERIELLNLFDAAPERLAYVCENMETIQHEEADLFGELIATQMEKPREAYLTIIEKHYDRLPNDSYARDYALESFMRLGSRAGYEAVAELLSHACSQRVELEYVFKPLFPRGHQQPDAAGKALFPRLFDALDVVDDIYQIYRLILEYADAGLINPGDYPKFTRRCVERVDRCLMRDAPDLNSIWGGDESGLQTAKERFDQPRLRELQNSYDELEMVLDLMRYLEHPQIVPLLHRATRLKVRALKMFAACSLVVHGEIIDEEILEDVASVPDLRLRLWTLLENIDQLDAFPKKYYNQPALAEAEMVAWLKHFIEIGHPPEEIAPIGVDQFTREGKSYRNYFFKFRDDDSMQGQWSVGMAGPYPVAGPPRIGGRRTFSKYERFESKTLAEHIADYELARELE